MQVDFFDDYLLTSVAALAEPSCAERAAAQLLDLDVPVHGCVARRQKHVWTCAGGRVRACMGVNIHGFTRVDRSRPKAGAALCRLSGLSNHATGEHAQLQIHAKQS